MKRLIKAIGLLYALLIVTAYPVYSQAAYFKEQLTLANMLSGKDSLNLQKLFMLSKTLITTIT